MADENRSTATTPDRSGLDGTYRVRADAFYVRQDDGVWLGNNAGSFTVRGQGAYRLVSSLFSSLDGRRTLAEIYGDLSPNARASVLRLVRALLHNGFVKEVSHPAEPVPDWMRERYATHLAFLEHHADRPVTRLRRVRTRRVVCAGQGVALHALLGASRELGIARLDVITGKDDADGAERTVHAVDGGAQWRLRRVDGDPLDELAGHPACEGADAVLLACDDAPPGTLAALEHRLRSHGMSVGVLGRCGPFVTALPPQAGPGPCWECVYRSFGASAAGDTSGLAVAAAPATVGALQLAQQLFARLAGVRMPDAEAVTTVEPLAPVVRHHTVHRHPCCPHHTRDGAEPGVGPAGAGAADSDGPGDADTVVSVAVGAAAPRAADPAVPEAAVRPDIPMPEDPPERVVVSDRIVAAVAGLTDPLTGPLLALGEDALSQLPLSAGSCRVVDPAGNVDRPAALRVVCRALSPREARNQAVLFAVEHLAARVAGLTPTAAPDPAAYRFGAGWTLAEARLRALLHCASDAPPGTARPEAGPDGRSGDGGVLDFLTRTLTGLGSGARWHTAALEELGHGAVRARVTTADGTVTTGVGTHPDQALAHALARAVAARTPSGAQPQDQEHVAFLAPPVRTWAETRAAHAPARDVTGMLPFLATARDTAPGGAALRVVALAREEVCR